MILLLSVCTTAILLSGCTNKSNKENQKTVVIPDANFKTYLLTNFDKNKDGTISTTEAGIVKEINCSGMKIEHLDGIESFINLTNLDCSNNLLSELDIRKNKKIEKLICNNNNTPLVLYIAQSGALRNPNFQAPKNNRPPEMTDIVVKPLDDSKCTYDAETTQIVILFDE
jgi:Leucine-rich repeat (LRR) protein